jgi:hypothetical protein
MYAIVSGTDIYVNRRPLHSHHFVGAMAWFDLAGFHRQTLYGDANNRKMHEEIKMKYDAS